jgi:hypothetical protein
MDNAQTTAAKEGSTLNQATDDVAQQDDWQIHVAKLIAYSQQIKDDYKAQTQLTQQIAQAEWRLSARSLALLIILLCCFASGLILLWCALLSVIGLGVYELTDSLWLSLTTAILLQIAALVWVWRSANYLASKIGFAKTMNSLKQLFGGANAN